MNVDRKVRWRSDSSVQLPVALAPAFASGHVLALVTVVI